MARHAKTQPLFPQISLLKIDSAYAWSILIMQTAILCYAQPLNNGICTAYKYFLRLPFSATPMPILTVNKRLRNLGQIQFIAKSSFIYTKKLFAPQAPDLLEKLAESLLYNIHREHILLKLKIKKVIVKNYF